MLYKMSYGRFDRMLAIPEEEYMQLKSLQRTKDPMENKFQTLSSDYQRQSAIQHPYFRNQRQGETLTQMINVKDAMRQRTLSATPRIYQSRAESLFQFVSDKLNMNDRGELVNPDGSVLEGSNITDLIQHSVRDRRRNMTPTGWSNFLETLRLNNVPRTILNYDTLEELKSPLTPARQVTLKREHSPQQTSQKIKRASLEAKASPNSSQSRKRPLRTKKEPPYLKDFYLESPSTPLKKRKKYL